jgi:putative transposase
MKLGIV